MPHQLKGRDVPAVCEVRGEVYMTKAGLPRAQQAPGGGRRARCSPIRAIRRPARCGRRTPSITASRPLHFFAYAWGEMSEMPADTPVRHAQVARRTSASTTNPSGQHLPLGRGAAGVPPRDRGAARQARLRHRRRGLQGRPARLAGAARLRLAQPALGDRAQVPGRAGDDGGARHRDPGRPHRRAHAGRQARAGRRSAA